MMMMIIMFSGLSDSVWSNNKLANVTALSSSKSSAVQLVLTL